MPKSILAALGEAGGWGGRYVGDVLRPAGESLVLKGHRVGSNASHLAKKVLFTGLTPLKRRRLMGAGGAAANARNDSEQ